MLNRLRYRIGAMLLDKASKLIENNKFDDAIKGLKLVKLAIKIVPPSRELTEFQENLLNLTKNTNKNHLIKRN